MQAIHVASAGQDSSVLELVTLPVPTVIEPHDILVRIKGNALNPIDTLVGAHGLQLESAGLTLRQVREPSKYVSNAIGTVLGYDASGIVEAAGPQALFKPGDEVFYAGVTSRPGSNAQFQLMDSRVVGRKPANLDWAEAAAIPLVGLTAWEIFEDKFKLAPGSDKSRETLLVINAGGGLGTLLLLLATKASSSRIPVSVY